MKNQAIVLHARDNVAVVVDDLSAGKIVRFLRGDSEDSVELLQDVPVGHKCAIRGIRAGEDVIKYGESIGRATVAIRPGEHVHIHNVESKRGRGDKENLEKGTHEIFGIPPA